MQITKKPKGILIAIGGREDKGIFKDDGQDNKSPFYVSGILKIVTSMLSSKNCRIEVITTASGNPVKMRETYRETFNKLGLHNIGFIHMESNEDTNSIQNINRITKAEGIFFTGGNQTRLLDINKNSEFIRELKNIYLNKEVVIAGTSAGAMVMSSLVIDVGSDDKWDTFIVTQGFSLMEKVIIDTHFAERGRFWRLADAVAQNPDHLGIGMDENTAVVVRNGSEIQVIGSGLVELIEGNEISYYDSPRVGAREKLTIENIITHILSQGDQFNIAERKILKKKTGRNYKSSELTKATKETS